MSIEIDPEFRRSAMAARSRRRARTVRNLALAGAVLLAGIGGWVLLPDGTAPVTPTDAVAAITEETVPEPEATIGDGEDFVMVQTEETVTEDAPRRAPRPSADIQGDPMVLRFDSAESREGLMQVAGPENGFNAARVGLPAEDRFSVLREEIVATQQRIQVVLPSTTADFALYQSRRSEGLAELQDRATARTTAPVEAGERVRVEEDGSWGDFIASDIEAEAAPDDDAAVYVETRIENTTSFVVTLRGDSALPLYEDEIVVLAQDRKLAEVLPEYGLDAALATTLAAEAAALFDAPETLPAGAILALRFRPEPGRKELAHLSIYRPVAYLGTLTRRGASFESGADPWFSENLLNHAGRMRQESRTREDLRLIDAIYSAALSNGLPPQLVGELIVALSKPYDLDRFANPGDRLTVVFASNPGSEGQGMGQIVYASLDGHSGSMPCYVLDLTGSGDYGCFDFSKPQAQTGGAAQLGGGLIVPVQGVKTSGFGPRRHPILKQIRNHNGVDWAAPTGTPVYAAMSGTVNFVGNGGGYGNVVYIDHAGSAQTRYAHLNAFADNLRKGLEVQAGQVIGYVGTTGRSTGPHLHFELHVAGQPVDPLTARSATVSTGGVTGSAAVEALVNQIIRVESAGNARAKNPLSTATGLGQFIESTWLRMMRDYRPDLHRSMSRAQLLELRFDPALSREMVRNLAREGESYLRARGHPITPGHLYLAHFLGAGGAHTALSADRSATVLAVMGPGVVNANPFLRGKTIGDLVAWSDRKMRGASGAAVAVVATAPAQPAVAVIPANVQTFRKAVDEILAGL